MLGLMLWKPEFTQEAPGIIQVWLGSIESYSEIKHLIWNN